MKKTARKSTKKSNSSSRSVSRHSKSFLDRGQGQMKMMILVVLVLLIAGAVIFFTRTLTGNQAMTTGSRASELSMGNFQLDRRCLQPKGELITPTPTPAPTGDVVGDKNHCISEFMIQCGYNDKTPVPTNVPGLSCYKAYGDITTCNYYGRKCLSLDEVRQIQAKVCGCYKYEPGATGIRIDDPTPARE